MKTENIEHRTLTQTHRPKSSQIAQQTPTRKTGLKGCVTTVEVKGLKSMSNCHNKRTHSFKPNKSKQTASYLSKMTTPMNVDNKRTNDGDKARLPQTVRMIPISIFDPTLLDGTKPTKQKRLNSKKQTNIH